ncbi:MAG TPA: hypothetical protein VEC12_05895, partial [Bacteroidia bacterium]|nr:hypothetical protein [Bacteroidia bacterium]
MKKFFTALVWALLSIVPFVSRSQVYFLNEDFSTATGSTPPAGWTNNTLSGDPSFDVWVFDNPGFRDAYAPMSDPVAIFDSDLFSSGGGAEDVTLESPAFNTTGYATITLKFDQYFEEGFGGNGSVEVWDGSSWDVVYSNSFYTANPEEQIIDISAQAANKTGVKIRFRWEGDYAWWWIIDNVQVLYKSDIEVTSVKMKNSVCGSNNEQVIVTLRNNSYSSKTNIP